MSIGSFASTFVQKREILRHHDGDEDLVVAVQAPELHLPLPRHRHGGTGHPAAQRQVEHAHGEFELGLNCIKNSKNISHLLGKFWVKLLKR